MYQKIYSSLIQPRSQSEDTRSHELIFNLLISAAIALTAVAAVTSMIERLVTARVTDSNSPLVLLALLAILTGLWYLSRRGWYLIGAYALVLFFVAAGTAGILQWSFETTEGELMYVVAIVMAGMLVGARTCLVTSGVVSVVVITIGYLQASKVLRPDVSWLAHPVISGDAIVYAITFWVIAVVMWLASREIYRSLERARVSEETLAAERDSLDLQVLERTQALERSQQERERELSRLAEFGRINAGLIHDLANPITSAALNLASLDGTKHSEATQAAQKSIRHLEQYVITARRQLQKESTVQWFLVASELHDVIAMLEHKAQVAGVTIKLSGAGRRRLYGDPVKFHQLAANLITNAIEAYDSRRGPGKKPVTITVKRFHHEIHLVVEDQGEGIPKHRLGRIFEPFYTSKRPNKSVVRRGTGLGLALVKQIVEDDFRGKITVTSTVGKSTRFKVILRDHVDSSHN